MDAQLNIAFFILEAVIWAAGTVMVATTPSSTGDGGQANPQILQRGYTGQRQQGVVIALSNQVQGNVVANHIGGNGDGKFRLAGSAESARERQRQRWRGPELQARRSHPNRGRQTLLAPRREQFAAWKTWSPIFVSECDESSCDSCAQRSEVGAE